MPFCLEVVDVKLVKFADERLEEVFLVLTMAAMVGLIFVQVFNRYVINVSLSWTEELARYIHIWQVWVGASYAVRRKAHLKVEMFKNIFPVTVRKWVDVVAIFLWFILAVFLAYQGTELVVTVFDRGQLSPAMRLPMWLPYLAIPVGGTLMTVRLIQQLVWIFRKNQYELNDKGGAS